MINNQKTPFQDSGFVRIVVGSTGLGLALMLGSLAAVRVNGSQHYQFGWNWMVPLSMIAAVYGNSRFWKSVWRAQANPNPKNKRIAIIHAVVLAALAIGAFLYPLRFIEAGNFSAVARGLGTAVIFLGILGTFIYQIGRALSGPGNSEPESTLTIDIAKP
jgi:polyferredoxin